VQGEAEVLEVGRGGARDVRADVLVVVRLLADGRDVDDADPGAQRAGAEIGQRVALGPQHRKPLLEQPGMHLAVGVDEVRAGEPADGGAERDRQHGGGVGRQAGRQLGVDDDHAALRSLSGRHGPTVVQRSGSVDRTVRRPEECRHDRT